jgi:hypothetical protein
MTTSIAGRFIDFHDDPDGTVIAKVASERPELLEQQVSGVDELGFVPDEQFAYVTFEKGAKVRHFPTNSPVATVLSAESYIQARDLFEKSARAEIEDNFKLASDWHGVEIPDLSVDELEKEAADRYALIVDMPDGSVSRLYALPDQESVKTASAYFEDWHKELSHDHRRKFASAVVERAGELGLQLEEGAALSKYASNGFGQQAYDQIEARAFRAGKDSKPGVAYTKLASMIRSGDLDLDNAVQILNHIDMNSGAGRGRDSFEDLAGVKVASSFSEEVDGDLITGDMLKRIATSDTVKQYFGEEVSKLFGQRPVEIFNSLPMDEKRVIKEIAYGRL